jgi:4-hydroxybenzoate polyprenyltransferase
MIKEYLKLFRLHQWIKNIFIFVPLVFSKNLFNTELFAIVSIGFLEFCIASSLVYVLNDIIDIESDRNHPVKKERPLAAGKISKKSAIYSVITLSIIVILILPLLNIVFDALLITFIILNIFYSIELKNIVIIDIFSIAAGFMLRIISGAVVINVEISNWLILTTMFISLFLGVMKRRSELTLVENVSTRKVLAEYSITFSDQMATIAAAGVIICYALYSVSSRTVSIFETEKLIFTTPFVVFGIFRYMYLVYMNAKGENTSKILVSDLPMIINILLYTLFSVLIIYKII